MTTVKHTPGPWKSFGKYEGENICGIESKNKKIVADVIGNYITPEISKPEAFANAKLIAAAPELLEALQELAYVTGHTYEGKPAMVKALSAIKKATE